jgi:hypothetical protein
LKADVFDRCGRILWRTQFVTLLASFLAALAIVAMHFRHGASPYFVPLDLFVFTIAADVYLTLASIAASVTHYPDHPATSRRFLPIAFASFILAILNAVAWLEIPRNL